MCVESSLLPHLILHCNFAPKTKNLHNSVYYITLLANSQNERQLFIRATIPETFQQLNHVNRSSGTCYILSRRDEESSKKKSNVFHLSRDKRTGKEKFIFGYDERNLLSTFF